MKGFLDSSPVKWGSKIENIPVLGGIDVLVDADYDEVVIASLTGKDAIYKTLLDNGVPAEKINIEYSLVPIKARLNFLRDYVKINKNHISDLAIAEGGVFQGDFAKELNDVFPHSTLYLFDTFEGFDDKDVTKDKYRGYSDSELELYLSDTSEELVMSKLPHPNNVVIRKGYFPNTTKGLEDERFFFFFFYFDLYSPILEGLFFFYPRLSSKGVILVHDFFNPNYKGVSEAISDFEKRFEIELLKVPIGDNCSIAIFKTDVGSND